MLPPAYIASATSCLLFLITLLMLDITPPCWRVVWLSMPLLAAALRHAASSFVATTMLLYSYVYFRAFVDSCSYFTVF